MEGLDAAKKVLYKNVDDRTVLFLSGGSTPKFLYQTLAKEKKLKVGAVAMVDERFGSPFHQNSNEKMINDTGFLSYIESENISFYGILKDRLLEETAKDYDKVVQTLFKKFQKRVAILGIGEDGHTASLPAGKSQISSIRHPSVKLRTRAQDKPIRQVRQAHCKRAQGKQGKTLRTNYLASKRLQIFWE